MNRSETILLHLLAVIHGMWAGEYCTAYSDDGFGGYNTMWCKYGCCGHTKEESCCPNSTMNLKIELVVGSSVLVGIIVSGLLAVFYGSRKSRGQAGQVCQPSGTNAAMPTVGCGQVGYNGAINSTVVTTNMVPGSVQMWEQPPPSYDQMNNV